MRSVAVGAGVSTMNVYSRFGGKDGLLDVLYREGFEALGAELSAIREPDLAKRVLAGSDEPLPTPEKGYRLGPGVLGRASSVRSMRTLNAGAEVAFFYRQIIEMSEGREPNVPIRPWSALIGHFARELATARRRAFRASPKLLATTP